MTTPAMEEKDTSFEGKMRTSKPSDSSLAEEAPSPAPAGERGGGSGGEAVPDATKVSGLTTEVPAADAAEIAGELKLVKTATLKCEVADVDKGFEEVEKIAKSEHGIVVGTSRSTAHEGYAYGTITVKVVPARYDETVKALRKVGRLLEENSSTEDVTAEYVDVDARLKNAEVARDRYLNILETRSATVPDILAVEAELTRITEKIESLKGQMRVLESRIGLSTITVQLEEPHATMPGGYSFGKAMREAFRLCIRITIFIIQAVIVLLPFLVLLIIILLLIRLIVWFFQRRKRKTLEAAAKGTA